MDDSALKNRRRRIVVRTNRERAARFVQPTSATFNVDPTSGNPRPANASQWTALLSSISAGSNPTHAYLGSAASGNLLDTIGSANLIASGSVTYSQAMTGQAALGVGFPTTAGAGFYSTSGPDSNATSILMLIVGHISAADAAERGLGGVGSVCFSSQHSSGNLRITTGAGGGAVVGAHTGRTVIAIRLNRTAGTLGEYTNVLKAESPADLTYASSGLGTASMGAGDFGSYGGHPNFKLDQFAVWEGAAAEKTNTQIKAIVGAFYGSAPAWSP